MEHDDFTIVMYCLMDSMLITVNMDDMSLIECDVDTCELWRTSD